MPIDLAAITDLTLLELGQAEVRAWLVDRPEVAESLLHQLAHGAGGLLDRHLAVHPVLVEEVDVVHAEPREPLVARAPDGLGPAVDPARVGVVGIALDAELGGEHHLVAATLDGATHQLLVDVRAVDLGGVDEGDAEVEGPLDGANGLRVVGACAGVGG